MCLAKRDAKMLGNTSSEFRIGVTGKNHQVLVDHGTPECLALKVLKATPTGQVA